MTRAFVALPIPEDIRSRLTVAQFLLPLPRRVDPADFHITLAFLGELDNATLDEVHLALSALRLPGFSLALRGFGMFGGDRPRSMHAVVTPCDGLARLAARVTRACVLAGSRPEERRFTPHVTLGRFSPGMADAMRLERAVAEGAGFAAGPWVADRFTLFRSDLHRTGARYEALADYPLTAPGPI
jgi:RNA 2',3'-cyclic 3'-phosphodiesterase